MSEVTEAQVRAEARAFLEENWDPNRSLVEWRSILADTGWGTPDWPKEWHGRGLPFAMTPVVEDEFARFGAVGIPKFGTRRLAAATILAHGNDFHKRQLLRGIITGEDGWCQLFSEPGSGSDLAGAVTRADLKDGKWIVNGQKVWNTSAHHADWGLLLARTDWDAVKHKGLSYFIINMKQPGVDVHQLKQMNGHASFNQVFLTDAVVEPEFMLGELGEGWKIATTTLMHERRGTDPRRQYSPEIDRSARIYQEEQEEIDHMMAPYVWYPQRAGRVDLLIEHARERGRYDVPSVRQEIARTLIMSKSAEWTAMRARAARALGREPGPEGSIGKVASSNVARQANKAHTAIAGAAALLTGEDGHLDGVVAEILVSTPATSIAGGTDEIQKNIISERILRMPKEPRSDTDRPFREVPRNQVG